MYKLMTVMLCVAGLACTGFAGVEPGTIELSGASSAMYSSQTLTLEIKDVDDSEDLDVSMMTLAADGVYYFGPAGVGGTLGYMSVTLDVMGEELDLSGLMAGVTGKYVHDVNDMVSVYGVGSVGLARLNVSVDDIDETADGYFFRLGAGAKYFLTDSVSVNGSLAYQMASLSVDVEDAEVTVDASGFMLGVGVSVYLPTGGAM